MKNVKLRQQALEVYYANRSICKECSQIIKVRENQQPGEARRKVFCSRSCATSYNNRKFIKRPSEYTKCPQCGRKKDSKANRCHECRKLNTFKKVQEQPIKKYIRNGNSRIKYSSIRTWAAKALLIYGREKRCEICGYDIVVEVHHIKSIISFSEEDLMGDVNAKENLKYLCPNHHAMLDRGLLDI